VRPAAWLLLLCCGCATALHDPPPLQSIAATPHAGAAQLLSEADAAWEGRAQPGQAAAAENLYLQAARADPRNAGAFAGAIRAKAFRLGREKDSGERIRLAESAVIVGQLCEENAPAAPPCDYWLAAALGLQARERTATAKDGLSRMTDLLHRTLRTDPSIDHGGPHRLLAIVLVRAPSWPLGPGDPKAALPEAQAAVRAAPDYPPNQLALGEALRKNGQSAEAQAAYARALRLASAAATLGDPEAAGWIDDARSAMP
jgi:tetratricopeptide (TPR) repeat protein